MTTNDAALVPSNYKAQRWAAQMVESLSRLGFEHVTQDGRCFHPTFSDLALYGDRWFVAEIDAERLHHYSITDLATKRVTDQLGAVLHKPVKAMVRNGLRYVIFLKPPQPPIRLPKRVPLDLANKPSQDLLLVPIGIGREGAVWQTLPHLGHSLIVGASGMGKSSFIHAALAALLTSTTPEQLGVILIDPKRSELVPWRTAPHLVGDIAYTTEQAAHVLANVVTEIDRRGEILAEAGVRDLTAYNRNMAISLSHILVVIDETLDLMLATNNSSDLVNALKIIASRGRSAGVILWCATQHAAAVSGLPRVVNVNLATRLVFRVLDESAARTAGCPGAERIDKNTPGRMLAKLDGPPVELQGHFLSDQALADAIKMLEHIPATPVLSDREKMLVRYAVEHLDGRFTIGKLALAFGGDGWSNRQLFNLGRQWEAREWLTKPRHATDSRKVTPTLLELAGIEQAGGETGEKE